ncbi:MAG: heavy-metal-associated domain-containing protein [Brevibacterium yomogidense]|uniref:Copper chaperone n=1 Tax=Brevibacterium yomogidense TaxID=946573 RepID=A0A1X6XMZ6_9MICO|nr:MULTISPECIES: heavy-metal-associated domain-containing protein [Brevibacterium]SLN00460.1 Copper chaperone [Brevibacterium yomogidense]SMX72411.1 Copper chaperone CopZ [Brevibacterium sp. Mu109]
MATATKNYTVEGMTCGHCKASVEEEVREVAGVTSVEATVDGGRVAVSGEGFTDEDIVGAVEEAGYTVKL